MPRLKRYGVPINNHDYRKTVANLDDPELTLSQKAVLVQLAHHTDENGYCFPSQKLLAKSARVKVRTVQRALKRLVELKYVRRASRTRTGFRNGSCAYAVTVSVGVPTRHHVEALRRLVVSEGDRVTELNRLSEQNSEQLNDPTRLVGDKLLKTLKPVVDTTQSPWMISTALVCKRLFNACQPADFEEELERSLLKAEQLCEQYKCSGRQLVSWSPLITRMQTDKKEPKPPKPSDDCREDQSLHLLIEELKTMLRASVRNCPKFHRELLSFTVFETPEAIEFSSLSRMSVDKVSETADRALKLMSKSYRKTVVLKHGGKVVQKLRIE